MFFPVKIVGPHAYLHLVESSGGERFVLSERQRGEATSTIEGFQGPGLPGRGTRPRHSIPGTRPDRRFPEVKNKRQMSSVPCTEEEFARHDVLVVATAHAAVRQPTPNASAQLAVDTRNLFAAGTLSCLVVRA